MTENPPSVPLPLSGVRVLELARLLPGNFCTLVLAMLGADVIKVEDPQTGDYMRDFGAQVDGAGACHHTVNRAKRSVMLDLKSASDRRRFDDMVRESHVLVESFRPGVMSRLGYSVQHLHELRPDLVIASISGYGADGPMAQRAGHDINYLALSGLLDRLKGRDGRSVSPPLPLCDLIGGGLLPATLILGYLHRARAEGVGAWIDASMMDGVALLPHVLVNDILAGAPQGDQRDSLLGGGFACYDTYRLADGQVAVGALEAKFFNELCDVVGGLDDVRHRHLDPDVQPAIRRRLDEFFLALTRSDVERLFGARDCCVTVVQSYEEMLASEHAQHRNFVLRPPGSPMPVLAFPAVVDGAALPERGPAPAHGQHNNEFFPRRI
jgi:crotonobetainyl-CoA:carnitine CoA-transferase CaiB-like acyl-CoA transferase